MLVYKHRLAHLRPYWDMHFDQFAIMETNPDRKGIVKLLPKLGYANRQVYREMVSYLLSKRRIEMRMEDDIIYFDKILHYMPISMGYHSVKKIAFTHFSQYASTPARTLLFLDFLRHLPNLEEVLLTMQCAWNIYTCTITRPAVTNKFSSWGDRA